jgi:hypothetical protein
VFVSKSAAPLPPRKEEDNVLARATARLDEVSKKYRATLDSTHRYPLLWGILLLFLVLVVSVPNALFSDREVVAGFAFLLVFAFALAQPLSFLYWAMVGMYSKPLIVHSPEERAERLLDKTSEEATDNLRATAYLPIWLCNMPIYPYAKSWSLPVAREHECLCKEPTFASATPEQQERYLCLRVLYHALTE